jgi:hypothetical protein
LISPRITSGHFAALASFPLIETDASHVQRAREIQRLLASRGLRGRMDPYAEQFWAFTLDRELRLPRCRCRALLTGVW